MNRHIILSYICLGLHCTHTVAFCQWSNKKHLKNVGPIRHCKPPHVACFTLPFTRCRTPPLSHAACASMSTTTTTTTMRERGGPLWPHRMGPINGSSSISNNSSIQSREYGCLTRNILSQEILHTVRTIGNN